MRRRLEVRFWRWAAHLIVAAWAPGAMAGCDSLFSINSRLYEGAGDSAPGPAYVGIDASVVDSASASGPDVPSQLLPEEGVATDFSEATVADVDASALDAAPDGEEGADLPLDPGFPATANADWTDNPELISSTFSTAGPNRLLVAIVVWAAYQQDWGSTAISGGGLTWTKLTEVTFPPTEFPPPGAAGVSIWSADAQSPIAGVAVTATRVPPPPESGVEDDAAGDSNVWTLAVYAFAGASGIGAMATFGMGYLNSMNWPLDVNIDPTQAGSWILGGFMAGTIGDVLTPPQPLADTMWDITNVPANNQYAHFTAVGHRVTATAASEVNQPVTIGSPSTNPSWTSYFVLCAAVEVLPSP